MHLELYSNTFLCKMWTKRSIFRTIFRALFFINKVTNTII